MIPVIVPTSSFHGRKFQSFSSRLSDQLVVGVESSGDDFNFSRSINAGIRAAVAKCSPDHVIVSNDDVCITNEQATLIGDAANSMRRSCAYLVPLINSCHNPISLITSDNASLLALMRRADERSHAGGRRQGLLGPLLSLLYLQHYRRALLKMCLRFLERRKQFKIFSPMLLAEKWAHRLDGIYIGHWPGPFGLYSLAALEKIGCFDERYMNGFEDFDLMYNLVAAHKFEDYVLEEVNLQHEGGSSLGSLSAYYYRLYKALTRLQKSSLSPADARFTHDVLNELIFQYKTNGRSMTPQAVDFISQTRKRVRSSAFQAA
jgi:hypothetical protein